MWDTTFEVVSQNPTWDITSKVVSQTRGKCPIDDGATGVRFHCQPSDPAGERRASKRGDG